MPMLRIYADYNGLQPSSRNPGRLMVPLDTLGSLRDLSNAGIRLREGLRMIVYDHSDDREDLEGDATVWYDAEAGWWYAELSEDGVRDVPARVRPDEHRPFRCLRCRSEIPGRANAEWQPVAECPRCGTPYTAAIAPPDAPASAEPPAGA